LHRSLWRNPSRDRQRRPRLPESGLT